MGMTYEQFRASWIAQLRAGALEIAENAEKIVGDLENNQELSVTFTLRTDTDEIRFPTMTIYREIWPKRAAREKLKHYTACRVPDEDDGK